MRGALVVLALSTVACAGGRAAPTPAERAGAKTHAADAAAEKPTLPSRPAAWVGVWHACSEMGSGWCAVYRLWADGRFRWHVSSMGCNRGAQERAGTWAIAGDTLVLSETARTSTAGGTCKTDESGEELIGAETKKQTHAQPRTERLNVRTCTEPHEHQLPCRMLGTKAHWRFREDPDEYP